MRKVRPALLKGFDQEFLPHEQLQFNALIELIRRNFERFGFLPIETPSAERIEVLTSKGGTEKEIYALSRLAADADDEAAAKGALRFDLTVPLARYVAMRERELAFPFRRYQIQRVWRGENPQVKRGRFREFYQCDIDIIGRETLSYLAEAEIPSIIHAVFHEVAQRDRKSTRLNSSHRCISYAVFCLKKKNEKSETCGRTTLKQPSTKNIPEYANSATRPLPAPAIQPPPRLSCRPLPPGHNQLRPTAD